MSYFKNITEAGKKQITERVKQTIKQKKVIVKQERPKTPEIKQEHLDINPTIKTIKDIPNVNIMTSGKLLGIHLRAQKKPMLKQFIKYLTKLLEDNKNEPNNKK